MNQRFDTKRLGYRRVNHDTYIDSLCKGLEEQWRYSNFTDTKIMVGDKIFQCHRVVLGAISPFFQAMYLSGMRESQDGIVTIQEVEKDTFEEILTFIYTGVIEINDDNVDSLLRASSMLQIKCLREMCEKYMLENVDQENCLTLWRLASAHECEKLTKKAREYVLDNFENLWDSEEFMQLDCDDIVSVIKDNDLKTPSEELVCEAVLGWINNNLPNRKQHIGKLFEHLRLPLMQPEYILSTIDTNKLITENPDCKIFVNEAKRYHLLPARRSEFVSTRLAKRNNGEYEEVVICIGGNLHPERTTPDVYCYSLKEFKWIDLPRLPYNIGVEFAICTYGNAIFVSGGSAILSGMVYFSTSHNAWLKCLPMMVGRRRHCMVAVGDSLYILGGYNDDKSDERFRTLMSVERYGVTSGHWEDFGRLQYPVRSAAASVVNDSIYIYGGIDRNGAKMSSIQCFDIRVRQCTELTTSLPHSGLATTVTCNNTTYLIFPNGDIHKIEEDKDIEYVGTITNFERCGFGAVQHEGKILIVGGKDSSDIYDEFVLYDPLDNTTMPFHQQMVRPLFGFGCVKSTIAKLLFEYKHVDPFHADL